MDVALTTTQKQRLVELNAPPEAVSCLFETNAQRDDYYKSLEPKLAKANREKLKMLTEQSHLPALCRIEKQMCNWLTEELGYTQVVSPIIISEAMLTKMTITPEHPLAEQVFWLEGKKCLRPMLAPNLYELMGTMQRVLKQPVKIFECGPCFRKESQGAQHLNEFTMLNLVELATVAEGEQMDRLKALAVAAMEAIGLTEYELEITSSEVYGETLDIVVRGVEVASGAYGPHPLDDKWGILDTWVGIGFGVERLAMVMGNYQNIKRVGRSSMYLDGARLNI